MFTVTETLYHPPMGHRSLMALGSVFPSHVTFSNELQRKTEPVKSESYIFGFVSVGTVIVKSSSPRSTSHERFTKTSLGGNDFATQTP